MNSDYLNRPENRKETLPSSCHPPRRAGKTIPAIVLGLVLITSAGHGDEATEPAADSSSRPLAMFSDSAGEWLYRRWTDSGDPETSPLDTAVLPGQEAERTALALPVALPQKAEFVTPVSQSWMGWNTLQFNLFLPKGLPRRTFVYIFTKDWDHLWRQVRIQAPPERGRVVPISVPIAGPEATRMWETLGHERPWHQLTPEQLLEYGVALEAESSAFEGTVLLESVSLVDPGPEQMRHAITNLAAHPRSPRVGERYEVTFELQEHYTDPFSRESVRVDATIQTPDGGSEAVTGFYYEGFLYDPQIADKTRTLTPFGFPQFKVRYCPRQEGEHTMRIRAVVEQRELKLPDITFHVQPPAPDYRGFLRRDPDHEKLLMWENGDTFWGIGINVRSPFDNRYRRVAPYSTWRNEGLPLYTRLFRKYREAGIDIVEVWMSSWWLALEWINDAPGFHGVGHYNQYRAWMLDHILEEAAANDIGIILAINNHGKFGALNDTEWDRNPYHTINGGFLENCEHYFTDERARRLFRQKCDYIVARWGHAPNLLSWKLFTEIDLTGNTYDFYQKPPAAEWHRQMGAYLKEIDPYDHLITTHWMLGYHRINDAIALLPELDFLTTDAYYQGGGTERLMQMLRGGNTFAAEKKKPLLITEYGGSPHADSMGNLIKQAHLGIWTGFFHEAPAAPMFWWFALIDEKDLYAFHTALRNFSAGEDRRGLQPSLREMTDKKLVINELRDDETLFAWGFDAEYYLSDVENLSPVSHDTITFRTDALKPGSYQVEFWDVAKGSVAADETATITSSDKEIVLTLPPFTKDFALKIKAETPPQ